MKKGLRLWAVLFWLLVWQLGSMALGSEILLVSPVRVIETLAGMVVQAQFWRSVGFSLIRIFGGFLLGALLGSLLAALSSRFRIIRELFSPLVLTIRTVPVASFIRYSSVFSWSCRSSIPVF